jgi:very-short-patch-repair endonuclease
MNQHSLARLSAYATRQLGLFTRQQAAEADISSGQLRRLVASGVIDQLSRDVYRFGASSPTWHQRVLAACLDGGEACLASHRTAAALHRLEGFQAGEVVEVLVPMAKRHRRRDVIVHHSRDIAPADRSLVGCIPCTSVVRTLIDLGAVVPAHAVEEAIDGAEGNRRVTRGHLLRRYEALRAPGRNGIGAMTQILEHREALERVPRSVLERRMLRLLVSADLPTPTTRFRLRLPNGSWVELDFSFAPLPLGVDVDGNMWHATPTRRARDEARANAIKNAGWEYRRFTYEQVLYDSRAVAAVLREALELARKRL